MANDSPDPRFTSWIAALDERHLANLTLPEIGRALRALSSCYVERRSRLAEGAALEGAGKRAAFALFYAPLHFQTTAHILGQLGERTEVREILDLGCGTGAAGAAWALAARGETPAAFAGRGIPAGGVAPPLHTPGMRGRRALPAGRLARLGATPGFHHGLLAAPSARTTGVDRSAWAVAEANWTYRQLGIRGRAVRQEILRTPLPARRGLGILAAYAVNELADSARDTLLPRLLEAAARGAVVLIVEPIARRLAPWWGAWESAFTAAGGRADEWRFPSALPPRQRLLAKSAGLNPQEATARSLFLAGGGRDSSV